MRQSLLWAVVEVVVGRHTIEQTKSLGVIALAPETDAGQLVQRRWLVPSPPSQGSDAQAGLDELAIHHPASSNVFSLDLAD